MAIPSFKQFGTKLTKEEEQQVEKVIEEEGLEDQYEFQDAVIYLCIYTIGIFTGVALTLFVEFLELGVLT